MEKEPLVLFDGVCNFCAGVVQFLLRQDKQQQFYFTPIQSDAGQLALQQHGLPQHGTDSFVLITGGKAYQRSTAALKLALFLPWYWQWTRIFWIIPEAWRDAVYNGIARNRYRWFGKKEACMIPGPAVKSRFLN